MPIIGLTDRGASFPQIGILRKGAVKGVSQKGTPMPGKDLKFFRLDTKLPDVQAAFEEVYGKEPVSVRVFLPYQTPQQNMEAWREEYSASSLIHRCDGQTMTIWRTATGGYSQDPKPCPYANGTKQRTQKEPGCKPVCRLKVIVPELQRLAYLTVQSTSIHDIIELTGNLQAAYALHNDLRGIPFILRRAPRMISMPKPDGSRQRVEKWLLFLEPAPDWVSLQLSAMSHAALPVVDGEYTALPAPARLALASGSTVDLQTGEVFDDEDEEGEDDEDEEDDEQAKLKNLPSKDELPAKDPASLKLWLMGTAKKMSAEPELTTGWRDGLIAAIDRLTETDGHHALFQWAFGNSTGSRKALTNGQVHAVREWLQLHKEPAPDGKDVWMPSETALAELMTAYPVAKESYTPPEIPEGLKGAVEANAQSLHS